MAKVLPMEDYIRVAVIGDSTLPTRNAGLLDCVNENSDVTIVISDNETTAMTGGQDSAGTGRIKRSVPDSE